MKKLIKKRYAIPIATLSILTLIILILSYHMMYMLLYTSDAMFYGKKQSILAQEIRDELSKLNDIRTVSFKNEDGQTLAGNIIKRPKAKANMLLCHGYRASKEFMYGFIDLFPDFNMLLFDFRAHGQSEGCMISIGCHEYRDVLAATHYMKKLIQKTEDAKLPFIILGISMGAASALKAVSIEPNLCDALIIDSTFADLNKILVKGFSVKAGLPYYPFFPIVRYLFEYTAECKLCEMRPVDCVKKITKPIFYIHSCNDNFISPKHGLRLYENTNLSRYTDIWIGPKCRHGWLHSYYSDAYKKNVNSFLHKALNIEV